MAHQDLHDGKRNGLIDGIRGLSVILVVVGHLLLNRILLDDAVLAAYEAGQRSLHNNGYVFARIMSGAMAALGVKLFFIISGYLITSLLVAEDGRNGQISLAAFYTRRVFRILPVYIAFLAFVYVANATHLFSIGSQDFFSAATFQCNLRAEKCIWWVGHTWSLAVEEQFYLVWPLLFAVLNETQRRATALGLLGVASFGALSVPALSHFTPICIGMVCGCDPRVAAWFKKNAAGWTSNIAVLVVLAPFVMKRAPELRAIFELATPVALAFIFFATINGRGLLASAAKVDMIRRVGLVSYSLYLWQQVFAGRPETYDSPSLLAYWGLMFPVAWLSYVVIEQTGVRIGRRLSARITARAEQTASGPAAKTA